MIRVHPYTDENHDTRIDQRDAVSHIVGIPTALSTPPIGLEVDTRRADFLIDTNRATWQLGVNSCTEAFEFHHLEIASVPAPL